MGLESLEELFRGTVRVLWWQGLLFPAEINLKKKGKS